MIITISPHNEIFVILQHLESSSFSKCRIKLRHTANYKTLVLAMLKFKIFYIDVILRFIGQ